MNPAGVLFAASLAAVVFIIAGYPVLLWLITKGRERRSVPPDHSAVLPTVSVLIPVRNGEAFVGSKLDTLSQLDYPQDKLQIIIIDDGSDDATCEIVRVHPANAVLINNQGSGKAAALNTALTVASGDILFLTDVRQPLEPSALQWLVAQFADPQVGVATGELIILDPSGAEAVNVGLYWQYEKLIRKRHSHIHSVLGATGAIYAIRRRLARPLPPGTLLDDMLMPLRALLAGYRIVFVPEARAFDYETDTRSEFRRKVRTQAGVYQLLKLCPGLMGPGNRMWIHFLIHKVGRLMLPWLLLAMFVASFFLPQPWATLITGAQLAVLLLALVGPSIPSPKPLRRVSSVLHTFLVLMWAAACAISILFRPADSLWKPAPRRSA